MATIDAKTGKLLSGINEAWQSVEIALATPKGSRIMRRLFGARRASFVDRGLSSGNLIDFYAEIAETIQFEPRIRLTTVKISSDSDIINGHAIFDLEGVWYPRGHLGDFSEVVTLKGSVVWSDAADAAA